jgi:hypothetical protein
VPLAYHRGPADAFARAAGIANIALAAREGQAFLTTAEHPWCVRSAETQADAPDWPRLRHFNSCPMTSNIPLCQLTLLDWGLLSLQFPHYVIAEDGT